jgi:hypothetical protein
MLSGSAESTDETCTLAGDDGFLARIVLFVVGGTAAVSFERVVEFQ